MTALLTRLRRRQRIERRLLAIRDEHPEPRTVPGCRGCDFAREGGPEAVASHWRWEHRRRLSA